MSIKLLLLDVDGVMTDGSIIMDEYGEKLKKFNVKDGIAIELLRLYGVKVGVISGKSSGALLKRCEQLGLDIVITGCKNKLPQVVKLSEELSISLPNIAFCGDDIIDIPVFEHVGFSIAPSDSHQLAIDSADWVTKSKGGEGVVREIADHILLTTHNLTLKEIYQPLLDNIYQKKTEKLTQ